MRRAIGVIAYSLLIAVVLLMPMPTVVWAQRGPSYTHVCIQQEPGLLSSEKFWSIINALRVQVERDFAPEWGVHAQIDNHCTINSWNVTIVHRESPVEHSSLGFHHTLPPLTPNGEWTPFAYVYHGSLNRVDVATVVSHEVLEMLADPYIDNGTPNKAYTRVYQWEIADPVEDWTYDILGEPMSDFVYKAWFDEGSPGPYDHLRRLTKPLSTSPYGSFGSLGLVRP
jgi:hypothetical protein